MKKRATYIWAMLMALSAVVTASAQMPTPQAQPEPLLVSSTSVAPGETLITGFVSSFKETLMGPSKMTQMTITRGNVGTKLVYYGQFPFKEEEMRGTTRTFLVDRTVNPIDEHVVRKMLVARPPVLNSPILDPNPAYEISRQPLAQDTERFCGKVVEWEHRWINLRTDSHVTIFVTVVRFETGLEYKFSSFIQPPNALGGLFEIIAVRGMDDKGLNRLVRMGEVPTCGAIR